MVLCWAKPAPWIHGRADKQREVRWCCPKRCRSWGTLALASLVLRVRKAVAAAMRQPKALVRRVHSEAFHTLAAERSTAAGTLRAKKWAFQHIFQIVLCNFVPSVPGIAAEEPRALHQAVWGWNLTICYSAQRFLHLRHGPCVERVVAIHVPHLLLVERPEHNGAAAGSRLYRRHTKAFIPRRIHERRRPRVDERERFFRDIRRIDDTGQTLASRRWPTHNHQRKLCFEDLWHATQGVEKYVITLVWRRVV